MLIIGCDYHPSVQQIAWADTATGDCGERRLAPCSEAEQFYRDSLETLYFDSPHEGNEGELLATPRLGIYYSADDAATDREGLEIVETVDGYGDLWFFASDGSPLGAKFSKDPHFNDDTTYFPGNYSLERGLGGEDLIVFVGEAYC